MKKSRLNWTVKKLQKELRNGTVSFDYPIQRSGGQWGEEQVSLLIHSVACDYPVPPLYALAQTEVIGEGEKAKEGIVYYLLDGKQRTTNIINFIENKDGKQRLVKDTPKFKVDGESFDLSGASFEEFPENVQDAILEFTLDIFKVEECDDDEISDMFFRLNNGTPLTQVQKAKANMGNNSALKFKEIAQHEAMTVNAVFTKMQITKADNEVALLQAMMLLDDNYTVSRFGNTEVYDYASALKEDNPIFDKTKVALDFLHKTLGDNVEKVLLRKLHLPFVVWASYEAVQNKVSTNLFAEWLESFKEQINEKENGEYLNGVLNDKAWLYKLGCGAGATKADKVANRWKATKESLEGFVVELDKALEEDKKMQEQLAIAKAEKEAKEAKAKAEKEAKQAKQPEKKPEVKATAKNEKKEAVAEQK